MLIKRIIYIACFVSALIALDFLFKLGLNLPMSNQGAFTGVGFGFFIYLIWKYKSLIENAIKQILSSKKRFLLLETVFILGTFYFLGQELANSLFDSTHLLNRIFEKLSDRLFFYTTLISGSLLVFSRTDKPEPTVKIDHRMVWAVLLLLVIIGGALRLHKLGAQDIRGDEFQVISAAAGYLHTGEYHSWNWVENKMTCDDCFYDRAWPHTWMVAQSYHNFGISEFSSRLPSAIIGTLTILIAFGFNYFFTRNKLLSLLVAFLVTFNPAFIALSRYTRMYVVLIPLFLLLLYTIYRSLTENTPDWMLRQTKKISSNFNKILRERLNFQ